MVNGILAAEESVNLGAKVNREKLADLVGDKCPDRNDGRGGTISINFSPTKN